MRLIGIVKLHLSVFGILTGGRRHVIGRARAPDVKLMLSRREEITCPTGPEIGCDRRPCDAHKHAAGNCRHDPFRRHSSLRRFAVAGLFSFVPEPSGLQRIPAPAREYGS
jgi:hypothetical protein